MTTARPWKINDCGHEKRGGYIEIRGPNDESICTIFPGAGKGGVGLEAARANAALIVTLANQTLRAQAQEIARLTEVQKSCHLDIIRQDDEIKQLKLGLKAQPVSFEECAQEVKLEWARTDAEYNLLLRSREAIRAKTIEECISADENATGARNYTLRALAQTDEGLPK